MVRLAALSLAAAAAVQAQSPVINYATNLGIPYATAAAADSAGNLYVTAGKALFKIWPDGAIESTSIPVPDQMLSAVTVDPQDRPVVGGYGFVARPPDFVTAVDGNVLQLVVDRSGNISATTGDLPLSQTFSFFPAPAALVRLSTDGVVLWTKPIGGASNNWPSDLVIDNAGSNYVALVTNSAELPADGFQRRLNGVPGAVSYDGGGYFYPMAGVTAAINHWLLTDSNTIYVGTQGQGVALSNDRGESFTSRSQGLPDMTVNMLAVDPASPQTIYAATGKGLAKSTNSGANWNTLRLPSGAASVKAIAVHPKNRANLYAATISDTGCAFYRSTDAGTTWQLQQVKIGAAVIRVCVYGFLTDPNDVNGVYAVASGAVFAYGPDSWTMALNLPFLKMVVADPVNFSNWYAVADTIYKSSDKGATWTTSYGGPVTTIAVGRPYVVAGTAKGDVVISRDAGATWNPATTAPFAQPVRSLLTDSGTIFAGATYNPGIWLGKYSPMDGQLLSSTFLGGGGSETAARLAVDPQGVMTVAMESDSTDAPTTLDAAQRRPGGGTDIVVTRLTQSFGLQYASYFGGFGDERIGGVKLDARGFLYMAGSSTSQDLPVSTNALQAVPHVGTAFMAAFNPSANGLVYSSYADSGYNDLGIALIPDTKGNAVLVSRSQYDSVVTSFGGLIGYQSIGAIRNAASLVAGSVAAGSLATIDGPYGPISGISVTFNGVPATVVQSRENSMDVALPDGLQPGTATVSIQSRNGLVQGQVAVGTVAPGLFSANHDGKGVALATLVRVYEDGTQQNEAVFNCTDTCTALPIDFGDDTDTLFLQLTATGLRNEPDLSQFQVTVGGQTATVISVSPQGISPGLDQITIQLPRPVDGFVGPAVWNIQVKVDGQSSNTVTILVG